MVRVYTKEELTERLPQVQNLQPHARTSPKYAVINTESVVDEFLAHNYSIVGIQGGYNDPTGSHLIEFQHNSTLGEYPVKPEVGGIVHRIGLYNAHNGLKPYQLIDQVYRYVCANGAKVKIGGWDNLRIIHRGSPERIRQVIENNVTAAIERGPKLMALVQKLQNTQLDPLYQVVLAQRAIKLRWSEVSPNDLIRKAHAVLQPRRREDLGNDAWTVFNRIQENLLKGFGVRDFQAVRSVNTDISLNQQLFEETMKIAA